MFAQASVLNLYDPDREQAVTHLGRISGWDDLNAPIAQSPTSAIRNVAATTAKSGTRLVRRPARRYSGTSGSGLAAGWPLAPRPVCTGGGVTSPAGLRATGASG